MEENFHAIYNGLKVFEFVPGRQGTGYEKLKLFSALFFDSYVLRFDEGSYIPEHVDIVDGFNHFRLNVILRNADEGGEFRCDNVLSIFGRVHLFRPDIEKHLVTEIHSGRRIVLSFGMAIPKVYNPLAAKECSMKS
jgi:hypothetical protein